MRMYHPDLGYTRDEGQETTEEAFRLAWEPKGWLRWKPKRKTKLDVSTMADREPVIVEVDDE